MRDVRKCRACIDSLEPRVMLATFTVTNTDDSGAGSLRQAILDANGSAGADVIEFDIASAPRIIRPTSALPVITQRLTINGTSQSGYTNTPLIEINGKLAGSGTHGLRVNTGALTLDALAISSFNGAGVYIAADGALIERSRIGTDPTGKFDRGNGRSGIIIDGASNTMIGGEDRDSANIIAFSGRGTTGTVPGILIFGGGTGNAVLGNSIFSNRGQAIDIVREGSAPDGINPADVLDPDTGTNDLQNQPFVQIVTQFPTETHVFIVLRGKASTEYRIEYFVNPLINTGAVGTRTFLHADEFTTDSTGHLGFSIAVPKTTGVFFTASATDPDNNTSEVSLPLRGNAGNVTGTVYDDRNGDGKRQSTDPALAGVGVFADQNGNGVFNFGEPQATSNSKGKYTITNLSGGPVKIRAVVPDGRRITFPAAGFHSLTMPTAAATNRHFGLTTTGAIAGFVYQDLNSNQQRDGGDTALSGATVFLDKDNDGVLDSGEKRRITNSLGEYRFNALSAGKYVIRVISPNGFTARFPSPPKQTINLAAAQIRGARNFGFVAV
jgi:SdrD B-like domain